LIVELIDDPREEFGVAPICDALQVAPFTYYSAEIRPLPDRAIRDAAIMPVLLALWKANYSVYGARKLWIAVRNAGHEIDRDRVARLMRELGIWGVKRSRRVRVTRRDDTVARSPVLVERDFTAEAPNQLWVTDLTYVATWSGWRMCVS
jgi:putative transposase